MSDQGFLERILARASEPPPLTTAQLQFLRLHVKHLVDRWQWHFRETMLRAHSGPRRATISRAELDDLVARGLVTQSYGNSVYATMTGRDAIE